MSVVKEREEKGAYTEIEKAKTVQDVVGFLRQPFYKMGRSNVRLDKGLTEFANSVAYVLDHVYQDEARAACTSASSDDERINALEARVAQLSVGLMRISQWSGTRNCKFIRDLASRVLKGETI